MHGLHLSAEFHGCEPQGDLMHSATTLRALCERAVAEAGLTAVGAIFHGFDAAKPQGPENIEPFPTAGGATGVVLLAESHLAVHTWPEHGSVTVDIYVCNVHADRSAAAHAALESLRTAFSPRTTTQRATPRDAVRHRT